MKKALLLALFVCSLTNAQYKIDFKNAPINPIPVEYHSNHYSFNGAPISVEITTPYDFTIKRFKPDGRLTYTSGSGIKNRYVYDAKGNLTCIRSKVLLDSLFLNYKTNIKGYVTEEAHYYKPAHYIYEYNAKGLYSKKTDVKKGSIITNEYDSKNRIIKQTETDLQGNIEYTKDYTYTKFGDLLKIVGVTNRLNSNKKYTQTLLYNNDGVLVGSDNLKDINEPLVKHEIDGVGNYTKSIVIKDGSVLSDRTIEYQK